MRIIGYHTCKKEGKIEEIEASGPFWSTHEPDDPAKHKFLGSGYYFWDNNKGMAHSYGKATYRRKYYIFEAELKLTEENFFDLVGNRIHMLAFMELVEKFKANYEASERWPVGAFIEFLKSKGIFPYKAIRALDSSIGIREITKFDFASQHDAFTNLSPIYIVCLLELDNTILTSFKFNTEFPLPK
ncbi:hypothetical protein GO755_30420 [Spirosoma sp. HMF4905]|uniref:Uncharacterized protein n=1 Tax=Spirosoma arboris TaxID=2682092 RepID=A0A7K1SLD5_9BACT|nr:hypothetical protein [Spirosoma arboris]MVM34386.1 hypothetical protein [Spirosoma arboris]